VTLAGTGTTTFTTMPTYTGSTVISGGTLNFALGTNSGNLFTTRTNTISGSGNLAVSAAQILLTNSISLGGSQSYIQTGPTNYGYILVGGAVTLSGSSITLSGDLGAASTNGTSLTLNTSSNNGAINLNISDGWSSLTNIAYGVSLTANAGTGTITWSGTGNATGGLAGGYPAIWASPVTLIGAVNITAPIYMGVNPSLAQISGTAYIGTDTLTINSTANGYEPHGSYQDRLGHTDHHLLQRLQRRHHSGCRDHCHQQQCGSWHRNGDLRFQCRHCRPHESDPDQCRSH
jgi:autotransporter-associated beta strand protein